ncbi:MAG: DsbA family protein [Gaiellaceae bacterium]
MASGKANKRKRSAERVQVPVPRGTRAGGGIDRRIWVAAAVAAALLVAVVVGIVTTRGGDGDEVAAGSTLADAAEVLAVFDGIPQDGVALGPADAPVTLVEFVDMQCPFCREFEVEVMPTLIEKHVRPNGLRIELRGLSFIGPDSERGLRAILAAGDQDQLFGMKALQFANQGAENSGWLSQDLIEAAGRSLPGLDVSRLVDDMSSDAVSDQLGDHAAEAERRGVNSTPTILVGKTGGEPRLVEMASASDLDAIEQAIAAAGS